MPGSPRPRSSRTDRLTTVFRASRYSRRLRTQGYAHRPYEHTRRTSTRSAPPWSGRRPSAARAPSQNKLPLQHKCWPSRHDGRPRTTPRPCWRAGRPRTGRAPVPARALSWDTGSAAPERTASQHGAPPYQNKMSCQHNPVHVLGRRACQDTPSSVLARGASQDGRSPVPARNRVLGHRGAVLERPATWNAPPVVPERRAVPAWVGGVPGRGGQSANDIPPHTSTCVMSGRMCQRKVANKLRIG